MNYNMLYASRIESLRSAAADFVASGCPEDLRKQIVIFRENGIELSSLSDYEANIFGEEVDKILGI